MPSPTNRINVPQRTHFCTADDTVLLTAVLGSCVAMCVYDEMEKVGGMNHILLPGEGNISELDGLFGANLVELLLNEIYQKGARRGHLKFKLFGGAKLLNTGMNVGAKNVEFVLGFLATEGMNIVSSSLGGGLARQIEFNPTTGRTRQRFIVDQIKENRQPQTVPVVTPETGSLEMF